MKSKPTQREPEKRYWWIILIVVPVATALIAILPTIVEQWNTGDLQHKDSVREKEGDLSHEREKFYWSQISTLTQVLEKRLNEDGKEFRFSRYYQDCEFTAPSLSSESRLRSELHLAGIGLAPRQPASVGFNLDDLRADSDKVFASLDTLGKALSSDALSRFVFLIEVRSGRISDEIGATIYTEVAADAIREYLVTKYGISRCRLIARGIGDTKAFNASRSDAVMITNYGEIE